MDCISADFPGSKSRISQGTVPEILFVGLSIADIVLVAIELCRPHLAEERLLVLVETMVPSYQNEPLCVSLSSFHQCRNFAIHVAVYVSLADH